MPAPPSETIDIWKKEIIYWFNKLSDLSPFFLVVIIFFLVAILWIMYKYFTSELQKRDTTNAELATQMLNIKAGNSADAIIAIYPESRQNDDTNSYLSMYQTKIIINTESILISNEYGLRLNSKSSYQVKLLDGHVLPQKDFAGSQLVEITAQSIEKTNKYLYIEIKIYITEPSQQIQFELVSSTISKTYTITLNN